MSKLGERPSTRDLELANQLSLQTKNLDTKTWSMTQIPWIEMMQEDNLRPFKATPLSWLRDDCFLVKSRTILRSSCG